jgi:FkbM family methyltransferase
MGEERVVIDYIRHRLPESAVCFVLGANAGLYVLQLAHMVGPKGRVVAFEPNPTTVDVLNRHVAMNGFTGRVTVVPAAVGRVQGSATLFAGVHSMLSRLGDRAPDMEEKPFDVEVPVTTLDAFCTAERLRPDWITMDIEGFEFAALEGARETFRSAGRPLGITAEFHLELWHLSGYDAAGGRRLIADLGFDARPLTGQADLLGDFGLVALEPTAGGRN